MSSIPTPTKTPKSVLFQVCRAHFGAVCAGKLNLKESVVANKNNMVVCDRIEFVRGVRGNIGVSRRVESANDEQCTSMAHYLAGTHSHLYESIQSGAPRTFSGSSWALKPMSNVTNWRKKKSRYNARLDKRPERKHGFDKRCRALWRVLDRGVCHVEEEVAHVDDHGVAKGHVRHVIPPISEPVDGPGLCSARLESLLEFRRPWRRAKLAHDGLAARIFGGG